MAALWANGRYSGDTCGLPLPYAVTAAGFFAIMFLCDSVVTIVFHIVFVLTLIDLYWRIRSIQWVLKYSTWNCMDWSTISCLAVSIDLTEKKCSHGAAEVTFEMHDLIIGDWDWLWFTDRVCCITVYAGVCVCVCVCDRERDWERKRALGFHWPVSVASGIVSSYAFQFSLRVYVWGHRASIIFCRCWRTASFELCVASAKCRRSTPIRRRETFTRLKQI